MLSETPAVVIEDRSSLKVRRPGWADGVGGPLEGVRAAVLCVCAVCGVRCAVCDAQSLSTRALQAVLRRAQFSRYYLLFYLIMLVTSVFSFVWILTCVPAAAPGGGWAGGRACGCDRLRA